MAQAVSRRPLTAKAPFLSQVSPCGVCGEQSGTVTGFSPSTSVSPVSIIPPMLRTRLELHVALTRRTNAARRAIFDKELCGTKCKIRKGVHLAQSVGVPVQCGIAR